MDFQTQHNWTSFVIHLWWRLDILSYCKYFSGAWCAYPIAFQDIWQKNLSNFRIYVPFCNFLCIESLIIQIFFKSLSSTSKKLMQQVLHYFFLMFFTCQYQVIYYALKKSQDNWRFLWWMSDLLSSFIFWLSSDFFFIFCQVFMRQ